MDVEILAIASFVVITTFTPGPNNISSASMGILYGYKHTFRYLAGITVGFFLVMLLCGLISSTLVKVFPTFESYLRVIGAVYILWLAYHTLKVSYTFQDDQQPFLGFTNGFFLQLLNPKVIVYGLTLYASFLGDIMTGPVNLLVSALIFTGVAFCATSAWTLFGSTIRVTVTRPQVKQGINLALSLLLVATAVELSGVLDYLNS